MPLRINYHLVPDAPYTDPYVKKCLLYGSESKNTFVCLSDNVKYIKDASVIILPNNKQSIESIVNELNRPNEYNNLIINYLSHEFAQIINKITNDSLILVWPVWGGDLYNLPKFSNRIYDKYSSTFLKIKYIDNVKGKLFRWYKNKFKNWHFDYLDHYAAIKKIDYCCTPIDADHKLIQRFFNPKIQRIEFSITGIEDFADAIDKKDEYPSKSNIIQIGNSADPSNNHFEILKKISATNFSGKVYCPLSYGQENYSVQLQIDVRKIFTINDLEFMSEFLPREQYFKKLSTTGFAVMGHKRQQSFGNSLALLFFGAKLFLRKQSPIYKQFKKWGLIVFEIESHLSSKALSSFLSIDEQKKNRKIITERLSAKKLEEFYKNILYV